MQNKSLKKSFRYFKTFLGILALIVFSAGPAHAHELTPIEAVGTILIPVIDMAMIGALILWFLIKKYPNKFWCATLELLFFVSSVPAIAGAAFSGFYVCGRDWSPAVGLLGTVSIYAFVFFISIKAAMRFRAGLGQADYPKKLLRRCLLGYAVIIVIVIASIILAKFS